VKNLMVESVKIIGAFPPQDWINVATTAKYVSLKNYDHLTIVIRTGAIPGGAGAVTVTQAVNVAGGGTPKALAFTSQWLGTSLSGLLTETAVVANPFLLDTALSPHVIEIDADTLDVDGGFDCVTVGVATPGAQADHYSGTYYLSGARYKQATPPTAILD